MKISERKSVKGYMKDIRKEFKSGKVLENIIKKSDIGTVEAVKKANPDFVKAAIDYIKYAERKVQQGYVPVQSGKVVESSEERKAVEKSFTLDTESKIKLFRPDWWMTAEEMFIYHLIEAIFDASLLVEQGAARKFEELVDLYRTFKPIEEVEGWYFAWYGISVLFIDTLNGRIYRADNRVVRDKISKSKIKGIERVKIQNKVCYELVLENGTRVSLMTDHRLTSGLWSAETILKDNKKEYYQIHLQDRDNETGRPAVQFPAHTLLLLARFGLNTVKHMVQKDSLITCDHVDMVGNNNVLSNLQLVTRRDNCLRAKAKSPIVKKFVCSYDLGNFWDFIEKSFDIDGVELRMRLDSLKDYWVERLKTTTVEEILAA